MTNYLNAQLLQRAGVRTAVVSLGLAATAVVMASPAQAATYTADACTRASNTQCLFSGTSFNGLNANDQYAKNNNTLNEWKFHNSSTFIDTNLGSVLVYQRNKVSYCTGTYGSGTCVTIPAHSTSSPAGVLQNTQYARFLSFKWNA